MLNFPDHEEMPQKEDYGLDWKKITKFKVMGWEISMAEMKIIFFLTKNEYLLDFRRLKIR